MDNSNEWIVLIEEAISEDRFNSYEYEHFCDIEEIGSGDFGKVYRTNWNETSDHLALKSFNNLNYATVKEIIHEFKHQREVGFHSHIIQFYGITTSDNDDQLGNCWLVMEYADSGTLRNYLKNNFDSLTWDNKYNFAFQLANAVSCLHDVGIVHRDLHSNNILIHKDNIKLSDFGLTKRIEEVSSKQQARFYDLIPYIDPKKLSDQTYKLNMRSDVYSVGVILWEISSGRVPFSIEGGKDDLGLAEKITQGLRETPIPDTHKDYVKLYTECWNSEPDHRPDIKLLVKAFLSRAERKENDQMIDDSLDVEISQSIQMSTNQMMETLTNKQNAVIVDEIVDIILDNGNKGFEDKDFIRHINDYFKNQKIALQEIFDWLSYNQNRSNNISLLGYFHHAGIGTSCDKNAAFNLFFKASNQNNVLGQIYVGMYYLHENGTITKNGKLAFKYFKKVAEKGLSLGKLIIGYLYKYGIGVKRNFRMAIDWFENASNQGNLSALNLLGDCYRLGQGIEEDENKAYELYKKSAEGNHSDGITKIGICYLEGIGVDIDLQKAREYFEIAANKGNPVAMDKLGHMYLMGNGVEVDNDKAFEYFQRSEQENYLCALTSLGICYNKGFGTSVDKEKAFELFEKAAQLNDVKAQYFLAEMYDNGEGVEFDLDLAIFWYIESLKQGPPPSNECDGEERLEYLIKYKYRNNMFDE